MSGINPLIDTLLHEVLGRRGEAPAQRVLNEPVKPVLSGEGPRALRSDSRLDGRPAPPLTDLQRMPLPEGARSLPRGEHSSNAPVSTQTHFSPAARSIADVLLRFPAPPSVVRTPAPLMQAGEPPVASTLASRIESSIRDSGLFYESHLKRWYQGETTRQQLAREPQMLQTGRVVAPVSAGPAQGQGVSLLAAPLASPLSSPKAEANVGQGKILPNTVLTPATTQQGASTALLLERPAAASVPDAIQGRGLEAAGGRDMEETLLASRRSSDVVQESLQGIVRQQLEMLVTPTIRWEGDVWAGIFMALVINLPPREKEREEQDDTDDASSGWRSDIKLEVPGLGDFSASLWFYRDTLSLDLTTSQVETHQRLEAGLGQLQARLEALDMRKVQVKARLIEPEDDNGLSA
ncbi:flagellar hook-length control protein FliK [Vreelandella rituensis]|uniref:Flagellar hook-length control protein FliK n=1 Tax=Vreelandella rituensis TaxID=2282306 RepID=A0A368U4Y6_9GAMM|nr:flagellar hook-length control protein FliK [Halomonas rituensis]RCV92064.1 flagellar hook-length control protein FliK [Halomonas rituensis]